jgi:ribonuclease P protein component
MSKFTVNSLTENYEFQRTYKRGLAYFGKFVVLYVYKNNRQKLNLGITVTKKVGKACVRNRVRRLIYENMRLVMPDFKLGFDIVVVARAAAVGTGFFYIGAELKRLLKKANML